MDYTINLNEAHVAVLIAALEMYGRVGTGDLTAILAHPDVSKALAERPPALSHNVRLLLDQTIKSLVYPSGRLGPGSYYSIESPETGDTNRVACDMLQVLRHQLALDSVPSEDRSVPNRALVGQQHDEPASTGKQRLVTIDKLS